MGLIRGSLSALGQQYQAGFTAGQAGGGPVWTDADLNGGTSLAGASYDDAGSDYSDNEAFTFKTTTVHGIPDSGADSGGRFALIEAGLDYTAYQGLLAHLTWATHSGGNSNRRVGMGIGLTGGVNLSGGWWGGYQNQGSNFNQVLAGEIADANHQGLNVNVSGYPDGDDGILCWFPFADDRVAQVLATVQRSTTKCRSTNPVGEFYNTAMTDLYISVLSYVQDAGVGADQTWTGCRLRYRLVPVPS